VLNLGPYKKAAHQSPSAPAIENGNAIALTLSRAARQIFLMEAWFI
jgi:hypothetical protein